MRVPVGTLRALCGVGEESTDLWEIKHNVALCAVISVFI